MRPFPAALMRMRQISTIERASRVRSPTSPVGVRMAPAFRAQTWAIPQGSLITTAPCHVCWSPISGAWDDTDYDVFDGDQCVRRIYQVNDHPGQESWFWGVDFQPTRRKSYGHAASLAAAQAAFRAE
jgi:hypothetical protein